MTPAHPVPARDRREIRDLSMLVQRLIREVRKHDPQNAVAAKAADYLDRKQLWGSVLRDTPPAAPARTEE